MAVEDAAADFAADNDADAASMAVKDVPGADVAIAAVADAASLVVWIVWDGIAVDS